jgi:Uma2 family endonuclease
VSRDSQRHYTVDDYFTVEEMSEIKHEYYNGEIFAMAGASLPHNEIAANVLSEFRVKLRDSDCGAYGSDLRVQTPSGLYTYPDVSVVYGRVELLAERPDTVTNPIVLVEVLSEATEDYDRGEKFSLYKSIPSLRHYLLVAQSRILIDHWEKSAEGEWNRRSFENGILVVSLPPSEIHITLDEIYRRVFS